MRNLQGNIIHTQVTNYKVSTQEIKKKQNCLKYLQILTESKIANRIKQGIILTTTMLEKTSEFFMLNGSSPLYCRTLSSNPWYPSPIGGVGTITSKDWAALIRTSESVPSSSKLQRKNEALVLDYELWFFSRIL